MKTEIRQIAERLVGLRDVLQISADEMAQSCGISAEQYEAYESGETDIPVSVLMSLSARYNIELTTLLTGDVPKMHGYCVTRKGMGTVVERRKEYKYQALSENFIHKKASPFIVTVGPKPENEAIPVYHHPGQEFNLVMEGKMMIMINAKELILSEGDSIWFDSGLPHGMKALEGKETRFLAIIF